jgi:hypothetical protein
MIAQRKFDKTLAALKCWPADDQIRMLRQLADENGYVVVSGYSITGKDVVLPSAESRSS